MYELYSRGRSYWFHSFRRVGVTFWTQVSAFARRAARGGALIRARRGRRRPARAPFEHAWSQWWVDQTVMLHLYRLRDERGRPAGSYIRKKKTKQPAAWYLTDFLVAQVSHLMEHSSPRCHCAGEHLALNAHSGWSVTALRGFFWTSCINIKNRLDGFPLKPDKWKVFRGIFYPYPSQCFKDRGTRMSYRPLSSFRCSATGIGTFLRVILIPSLLSA